MSVTHGDRARRLISNTAILAAAQAVVRIASLVAFPLLTNSVEAKTYGVYLYAMAIAAAWAVLANFQLKAPLLRHLTREGEPPGQVVGQVLTLRVLMSLVVLVPTTAWCCRHFPTTRERLIFEILLLANLIQACAATFDEAIQSREAFRQSALAAVLQGLTVSGGIIVGVLLGRPIVWAVGAQFVGACLLFGLTGWFARRVIGQPVLRLCWSRELAADMVKLAIGVAVGAQIGAWYGRVDLIAVEHLLGATCVGQYGVAFRAIEVVMAGAMTLHMAVLPMLARAQAAGNEALAPRLLTVLRFGLLLFIPGCALVSCWSPQIIALFKPEYAVAAGPLAVLIWVVPLVFVGAVLHWVLFFHARAWQPSLTLAAALGLNLALCALLVPRHGPLGAAAARTTAEASIVLLSALLVQRLTPVDWRGLLTKPLLMALGLTATWLLTAMLPWWLRGLLALAAYALTGAALQPLEPREWEMVKGLR